MLQYFARGIGSVTSGWADKSCYQSLQAPPPPSPGGDGTPTYGLYRVCTAKTFGSFLPPGLQGIWFFF